MSYVSCDLVAAVLGFCGEPFEVQDCDLPFCKCGNDSFTECCFEVFQIGAQIVRVVAHLVEAGPRLLKIIHIRIVLATGRALCLFLPPVFDEVEIFKQCAHAAIVNVLIKGIRVAEAVTHFI